MSESLRSYLDFAVETAFLAGRLTRGYFQTGIVPEWKSDASPVTIADRESETLIRSRIEKHYPSHGIFGEEFGEKPAAEVSHRWIVDPIDGTKAFTRGVPLYAVLLGLEIEGRCEVGVAYFPALDEMLAGARGEGCWWNGRRAHVSSVESLKQAVISCSDYNSFDEHGRRDAWDRLRSASYVRSGWGDAYGYMLVATGRIEVMLDPVMAPWDAAPFPPILAEAGGYFGDWQGRQTIYAGEGLATTPALLPKVLELIHG